MKGVMLGVLAGAGLVLLAVGTLQHTNEVFAQRLAPYEPAAAESDLIVLSAPAGEKGQLITVIDPQQRVMSVYQFDPVSGKIALRSVRNIRWDLQMMWLNNESPLPQEIRSLLETR